MAWFEGFRNEHGFTSYSDQPSSVTVDKALISVGYLAGLLVAATIIATLGIRGREKWSCFARAFYAVILGSVIIVCLCGHDWLQGEVEVRSPYVYRSNLPFKGKVGVHIALHGTNITLAGDYNGSSGPGSVHFVESLPWADYGQETAQLAKYLQQGLPEPVLRVVEFLTADDGGLRWGRSFHSSGHFASALLWTSFAFWLVCNVLLFSVVIYGAYMCALTGLAMVLACVTFHSCLSHTPFVVTFGGAQLTIEYGWCFWLTLATGLTTLILGLVLIVLDYFAHDQVSDFFHLEKLDSDDNGDPCAGLKVDDISPGSSSVKRFSLQPHLADMRRGSIFLEPSRRPSWHGEHARRGVNWKQAGMTNNAFENEGNVVRNPLYCGDDKVPTIPQCDYSDDELRIDIVADTVFTPSSSYAKSSSRRGSPVQRPLRVDALIAGRQLSSASSSSSPTTVSASQAKGMNPPRRDSCIVDNMGVGDSEEGDDADEFVTSPLGNGYPVPRFSSGVSPAVQRSKSVASTGFRGSGVVTEVAMEVVEVEMTSLASRRPSQQSEDSGRGTCDELRDGSLNSSQADLPLTHQH